MITCLEEYRVQYEIRYGQKIQISFFYFYAFILFYLFLIIPRIYEIQRSCNLKPI